MLFTPPKCLKKFFLNKVRIVYIRIRMSLLRQNGLQLTRTKKYCMNSRFMNWNNNKKGVSKITKTVHSSLKVFIFYKTVLMSPVQWASLQNQKHSLEFFPKTKERRKNNNTEGRTVSFLISCNVLLTEKRCTFELFNWKLKSSTFLWWSFCAVQTSCSNVWVCEWNSSVWPFKWKRFSNTWR